MCFLQVPTEPDEVDEKGKQKKKHPPELLLAPNTHDRCHAQQLVHRRDL